VPPNQGQPDELNLWLSGPELCAQLADIRARLGAWARHMGLTGDAVDDLVLAASEALTNVIDHAYGEVEGDAWVHAGRNGSGIVVTVRDGGRWRDPNPDPGLRGRGLKMIDALADRVWVERRDGGTVVTMQWKAAPGDPSRDPGLGR
jgi:serine/threonine-protein kinase RsbW